MVKKVKTPLDDALRLGGFEEESSTKEDNQPIYRMVGDLKIPVSKHLGAIWKGRIDGARSARADIAKCWSEAIKYYENDQSSHRTSTDGRAGNKRYTRLNGDKWSETENVVFSTVVTMLPMLYARNPAVEVTTELGEAGEPFAATLEKLLNRLLNLKTAPGVNIKNKARRGVLTALLTNTAYLKIGYTQKEDSNEAALSALAELTTEYQNATDRKTIKEVEGKIQALEEKISLLTPSGPSVKLISPFRVFVDPTAQEPDHSDANWMAEEDFLPTDYLNAVYGRDAEGKTVSVYDPTHILSAATDGKSIEDEVNNFSPFNNSSANEFSKYGYEDQTAFDQAKHTRVWWIWDKTTRRVFLYADNSWKFPIWVWDDPLRLTRFFPYIRLWFHETPDGAQPKGEVTYYLDQQDAINDINSEIRRAREWAKNNILYDKNAVTQDDVVQVLKGADGTARGVNLPEGKTMKDVIFSFTPPSLQHPELWNTDQRFNQINRITGVNAAMRGAEFKTNTTNKAVDTYNKNTDTRIDEKIDAIEDWLGEVAMCLAELCCRYYEQEDVAALIGQHLAENWRKIDDPVQFRTTVGVSIVGGSTEKPTSKVKRAQALEIGQILGQFANGIPAVGVVMLKMFSRAFDEIVITKEDWDMILQTMFAQQQKAGAGPSGEPGTEGQTPSSEGDPNDPKQQIAQLISQLPEEAKLQLQQLTNEGISPSQALEQVLQATQVQPA